MIGFMARTGLGLGAVAQRSVLSPSVMRMATPGFSVRMFSSDDASYKGRVKWFSDRKGFGFIIPESRDIDGDVFVHFSNIEQEHDEFRSLLENEVVEFELSNEKDGRLQAAAVKRINKPTNDHHSQY
mmetsp:Transcript_533/g.763  ORF Transcript_533/g.763 Transcript_533/m.763 type:complete len:127 (+) Transcript_533:132-512(+)